MSTTYLSVDYFPLTVNFFDRDAIELAEAKYGIRVDGAVCKLLCKIFIGTYMCSLFSVEKLTANLYPELSFLLRSTYTSVNV